VSETNIKLTELITGDVKGSGTERFAEKKITTELLCEETRLANTIIGNGDLIPITLPQNANVLGVHIRVNSGQEKVQSLSLDFGNDGEAEYILEPKQSFTGEFVIEGQNMAQKINAKLAICENAVCNINIKWQTNTNLEIIDVKIPYAFKQF